MKAVSLISPSHLKEMLNNVAESVRSVNPKTFFYIIHIPESSLQTEHYLLGRQAFTFATERLPNL